MLLVKDDVHDHDDGGERRSHVMRQRFCAQFHSLENSFPFFIASRQNIASDFFADITHENNDQWCKKVIDHCVINLQVHCVVD